MRRLDLAAANVAGVKWKSPSAVRGWRPQPAVKLCLLTSSLGGTSDPSWACLTASSFFIFFYVSRQGNCDLFLMPSQHGAQQMWEMVVLPHRGINCGAKCDADTEPRLDARVKLSQAKRSELTFSHRCHLWAKSNIQMVWLSTFFNVWALQHWTQAWCNFQFPLDISINNCSCKCRKLQTQNTGLLQSFYVPSTLPYVNQRIWMSPQTAVGNKISIN